MEASIVWMRGKARESERRTRVSKASPTPRKNKQSWKHCRGVRVWALSVECVYSSNHTQPTHNSHMPPRRRTPATPSRDAAGRFVPTPAAGGDTYLTPGEYVARRDGTTQAELRK